MAVNDKQQIFHHGVSNVRQYRQLTLLYQQTRQSNSEEEVSSDDFKTAVGNSCHVIDFCFAAVFSLSVQSILCISSRFCTIQY